MKLILVVIVAIITSNAFASNRQMINALGASSKGQYVAVEEYGFNSSNGTFYSRIRLMNVWKKDARNGQIVSETTKPAHAESDLQAARDEARAKAAEKLKKFNIRIAENA